MLNTIINRRGIKQRTIRGIPTQENKKVEINYNLNNNHPILTNKKFFPISITEILNINLEISGTCYVITQDQNYILIQLTGVIKIENISIESINPETGNITTNIYLLRLNGDYLGNIKLLWSYPFILKMECDAQIKILKSEELIVLSRIIPDMSISNKKLLEEGFFLAKFNVNFFNDSSELIWVQIIKTNINILPRFCINYEDIYVGGTFENEINFNNFLEVASITSKLNTDMFLSKIKSFGEVEWIISSGELSEGEITLDDIAVIYDGLSYKLILSGKFRNIIDFSRGNEHIYLESENNAINLWIGKFDINGSVNWINCPQSINRNNYIDVNSLLITYSDIYITGTLYGEFIFNDKIITNKEVIYLLKMTLTGDFVYCKILEISNPMYGNKNPRLIFNNGIYLSFFGLGDLTLSNFKTIKGDGILNLWITTLYKNDDFIYPLKIPAAVTNKSNNITNYKDMIYIIGTQIITENTLSPFIKKLTIK